MTNISASNRKCPCCGGSMDGRKARQNYCGQACWDIFRAKSKERTAAARTRMCSTCDASFVVKKSQIDNGHGEYCSLKCASGHLATPENLRYANERRLESIALNGTAHKKGSDHPGWKGGRSAVVERRKGKAAEYLRKYRATNPEKVRGFSRNRAGRKTGRLPRGTVQAIGLLQKWKCAICRVNVKTLYHVDHILPLAKGGRHERLNLQILCPTCNVKKSAKHPVDFMQERGFLL